MIAIVVSIVPVLLMAIVWSYSFTGRLSIKRRPIVPHISIIARLIARGTNNNGLVDVCRALFRIGNDATCNSLSSMSIRHYCTCSFLTFYIEKKMFHARSMNLVVQYGLPFIEVWLWIFFASIFGVQYEISPICSMYQTNFTLIIIHYRSAAFLSNLLISLYKFLILWFYIHSW